MDAWRFGYGVPEVARGSGEGIEDAGNAGQGRAEMEARRDVEGICEVAGRRGRAEASAACGVQGGVTLEQAGDVFAFHDLGSRSSEPEAAFLDGKQFSWYELGFGFYTFHFLHRSDVWCVILADLCESLIVTLDQMLTCNVLAFRSVSAGFESRTTVTLWSKYSLLALALDDVGYTSGVGKMSSFTLVE